MASMAFRTLGRTASAGTPLGRAAAAAGASALPAGPLAPAPALAAAWALPGRPVCCTVAAAAASSASASASASASTSSDPRSAAASGSVVAPLVACPSRHRRSSGAGAAGRRPRALLAPPPRSTGGNGQVGPPPHRKGAPAGGGPAAAASAPAAAAAAAVREEVVEVVVAEEEEDVEELMDEDEAGQQLAPFMDAVVKVYCMHTEPNYSLPWQRKRQYSSSSSGFVVAHGGRHWLLTNAHSVDYHTQVKVKRRGDDRKFLARVISVGVDCDIAALQVDDPDFWAPQSPGAPPPPVLELGPLPRLQDGVAVVGYPIGGDTISVTAGVVSRIEVTDYSHGSTDLLAIQIDAAINGGNSGGPVFNRACQCVGIAFQALVGSDVENVGYVIPTPVVAHFLDDYVRTGGFSGFPQLGIQWQRMESEALRRAYGMTAAAAAAGAAAGAAGAAGAEAAGGQGGAGAGAGAGAGVQGGMGHKGVLVRGVNPTSAAAAVLRPDDVLLAFDGTAISNDGTVPFRTGERISFSYLVTNKFVGDTARLEVLRGGQRLELQVALSKPAALVPPHLANRDPSYLLVGGLVFTAASEPYLQSEYGAEYGSDAPVKLLDRLYHGFPAAPGEEVVVLSQVLACDATLGYEDVYNVQLLRLNGTAVTNLRQLAGLVDGALAAERATPGSGGFLRFDLEYNEVVVVEARDVLEATAQVMRSHSIPHTMSADLRADLAAAAAAAAGGAAAAAQTQQA
ncbi:hypothetical protein HYH02_015249 [Chlamydomonas schloesseri]|uniref:Protease Do-like PDZ domain-containing protein n=1 Tax=Chlamydomonas schloesseri TaxID=2026947 RepID=A0A835SP90_9CHLO|nr:hypothetical protein HYH02_015249 [Chlamydomonas schloesseri]|eukprot:KAG2424070.1 hypothetical protein HYH02_015249 [Chlamydomonas schloesseri]